MAAVAARSPADAQILQNLINELRATSELLDRQRPLRRPTALGGEARDESTLIEHLCGIDGLSGDLALPLKATLSRTHLLTKINFLRGFVKATAALGDEHPQATKMTHELREEVAQSIYTLLAEELFLALREARRLAPYQAARRRPADHDLGRRGPRDRRLRPAPRECVARAQSHQHRIRDAPRCDRDVPARHRGLLARGAPVLWPRRHVGRRERRVRGVPVQHDERGAGDAAPRDAAAARQRRVTGVGRRGTRPPDRGFSSTATRSIRWRSIAATSAASSPPTSG